MKLAPAEAEVLASDAAGFANALADPLAGRQRAGAIRDCVLELEGLEDAGELAALLAPAVRGIRGTVQ